MKKYVICFNVLVASTATIFAADESSPTVSITVSAATNTVTIANKPQDNKQAKHRKFKPSTLFQGLASTCAQAANVSSAQTQQEKQQATCNLLASIFQTAANVSKDEEKTAQKNAADVSTENTTEATIDLVLSLINLIKIEGREAIVADLPLMNHLVALPTDNDRRTTVTQLLATKDGATVSVYELTAVLRRIIAVKTPALLENFAHTLLNSLAEGA